MEKTIYLIYKLEYDCLTILEAHTDKADAERAYETIKRAYPADAIYWNVREIKLYGDLY